MVIVVLASYVAYDSTMGPQYDDLDTRISALESRIDEMATDTSEPIEQSTDRLLDEIIVQPGESYVVDDYGDLGENGQASLVCKYMFREKERQRVYWYSPNDVFGKSYCPEQFDNAE